MADFLPTTPERPDAPTEATLGFALGGGPDGQLRELAEPVVLATVLAGLEVERSGGTRRLRPNARETVESVANVYWPIAVLPAPTPGRIAVFDGSGVWRRSFRRSLLPPLAPIHDALNVPTDPSGLLTTLDGLRPAFAADPGAEVLNVEGFLPVDPPLLWDVLAQGSFPRDPQSAHPGFLPARHEFGWYLGAVEQIGRWVERFDADVQLLEGLRAKVAERVGAALLTVDEETEQMVREGDLHRRRAKDELVRESERLHASVLVEIRRETDVVRTGQATVARSIIDQRTADALAERSVARGTDGAPHRDRGHRAKASVREAHRTVRASLERLEALHERERSALVALTGRVTAVEHSEAERLAGRELFRDELGAAGRSAMDALGGHIAARAQQRSALQQYFVSPTGLPSTPVVWFPLWVAQLRGPHAERTVVFPPMQSRARPDLGTALKEWLGGGGMALEPRTALFGGAMRRTLEDALATDPWLARATTEIARGASVLPDIDLPRRLHAGLGELERGGWIGARTSRHLAETYEQIAGDHLDRAHDAPAGPTAVPVAA